MTRTEKWKEYRDGIAKEHNYLSVHQRDLLAMYIVSESITKLPDSMDEAIGLLITRFKLARELIEEQEIKEANDEVQS